MKHTCWASMTLIVPLTLMTAGAPAHADEVIEEAVRIILKHHVMHPDPAALVLNSRSNLLASLRRLDPAAQWWPPDMASANRDWTGAEIIGIGASVVDDGKRILFVPLPGGALAYAGMSQPVRLVALSGRSADQLGLESVQQILGDPANKTIEALVQDLAGAAPVHLVLKRSSYHAVSAERLDVHGVPILRIHRFVKGLTLRQFQAALEPVLAGGQAIVVDLRYSAGGDLYEALDTASLFLKPGLKLATMEDATERRTALKSVGTGAVDTKPIIILVGRGTVSASEVFAAALRDHGQARLIGTPTFGKCLAQSTFRLMDDSVLVLSTARILTSSGWYCDGQGLLPDIRVDPMEADDTIALITRFVR